MIIKKKRINSLSCLNHVEEGKNLMMVLRDAARFKGILVKLGFSEDLIEGERVLPSMLNPTLKRNAEPFYIKDKTKPKEQYTQTLWWTRYEWAGRGETREVTDFVTIPRERYARIKFEPYSVELFLKYDEQGQLMVMTDLISYCHDNEKLLINTINIFLTNFEECEILTENFENVMPTRTIKLNWEVLPSGDYPWKRMQDDLQKVSAKSSKTAKKLLIDKCEFAELFGGPRREPESLITQREMDIAASAQKVVEDIILRLVRHAKDKYGCGIDNLVLAGGVALNCVANGKIKNEGIFENMWIQPAAGDAGGALGSALYASYMYADIERKVEAGDSQKGSYLGPEYSVAEIEKWLREREYPFHQYKGESIYDEIAEKLVEGKVIGLFQGRMEFGPRALGNRSIIADARSEEMQVKLNLKIKFRESFRPFAPSVLFEDANLYFEIDCESPYMLLVENVQESRRVISKVQNELDKYEGNMLEIVKQKRSDIPAVTHVDYSARIQTVTKEKNEYYYRLIKAFKEKTGCGVIVNTSFNVRGEPIVCTPQEAYDCFMRTQMDVLVLENMILYKEEQPIFEDNIDWKSKFELD